MKYFRYLSLSLLIACAGGASAQNNDDARALVKDGVQLNGAGKYAEAIDKYKQALKIDSGYLFAGYQLAVSLYATNKGTESIPYLEKIIKADAPLKAAAFDLLGLICFKSRQYAEAERYAIEGIKLDPKHAGTMRMYALVTLHQNKRAGALLGFCSFILLEPNTPRSAEAFGNIQHILQGGTLKPEPGEIISHAIEADTHALNQAITQAVADAGKKKYATAADQLAEQLKEIFTAIGQLAEKQTGNDFFRKYHAAFFYKLAQSPNMPAFARLISGSTAESAKWTKDNPQQMEALNDWIKNTERGF